MVKRRLIWNELQRKEGPGYLGLEGQSLKFIFYSKYKWKPLEIVKQESSYIWKKIALMTVKRMDSSEAG